MKNLIVLVCIAITLSSCSENAPKNVPEYPQDCCRVHSQPQSQGHFGGTNSHVVYQGSPSGGSAENNKPAKRCGCGGTSQGSSNVYRSYLTKEELAHFCNMQLRQFGAKSYKGKLHISLYTDKNVLKAYAVDTFTAKSIDSVWNRHCAHSLGFPANIALGELPGFRNVNVAQHLTLVVKYPERKPQRSPYQSAYPKSQMMSSRSGYGCGGCKVSHSYDSGSHEKNASSKRWN